MRRVASSASAIVAGFALATGPVSDVASAATGGGEIPQIAQARAMGQVADLNLRYVQEDGPDSGHVRVILTPEARSLTVIEARMAAEQAFLGALKERGLGDSLKRITVVVRMMPDSDDNAGGSEQVVVYQYKGGSDWSVLPGN
jgi:hypothetical protein